MVVVALAMQEKRELFIFGGFEFQVEASGYNRSVRIICVYSKSSIACSSPSRSPQNLEYLSFSLASSLTTSNRLPALLMAWTAPRSLSSERVSNHLIVGVVDRLC